ncbi:MAG TPA: ABC transporter permease [Micromonosporaceae bacterium]|nr:ABC transporter permease [Micromonosporaceae bacterium]
MTRTPEQTGVIHDIGYQRYAGPRLGRRYVFMSLYVHGLRAAFGLGRSAKAKIFPWFVIGVVTLVAIIVTAVQAEIGETFMTYAQFAEGMSWLILFFVAVISPELISRDIGTGVLPLYFSRPLSRADYAIARLAAVVTSVFLLLGGPQLVMFAGNAFGEEKMSGVWDEFTSLLPGLGYAAMWAVVYGSLAALVASLTGKRAFGAGGIVAVFMMSAPVVGVLSVIGSPTVTQLSGLASPTTLVRGTGEWLFLSELEPQDGSQGLGIGDFGPLYAAVALVLVVTCVLLLLARYRRVAR